MPDKIPNNKGNNDNTTKNKSKFLVLYSFLSKPISTLSALIIGIAIGVAPIWFNNYLDKPELVGRVITISTATGGIQIPRYQNDIAHTVFLSIANKRKTPVSVIDYTLNLYKKNELVKTCRPFYLKPDTVALGFDNFSIIVPVGSQYLLNNTDSLITPLHPISGFLFFNGGEIKLYDNDWDTAKIILYDAFGAEYEIEAPVKSFRSPELLPFLIKGLYFINKKPR